MTIERLHAENTMMNHEIEVQDKIGQQGRVREGGGTEAELSRLCECMYRAWHACLVYVKCMARMSGLDASSGVCDDTMGGGGAE